MRRVRDLELLRRLHVHWDECVICGATRATRKLTLHHLLNKPRDDVEANLVMLCGDGTTGCHGKLTAEHEVTRRLLGAYLTRNRPDTMAYLAERLGGPEKRAEWLQRRLYASL